ncbi:MauE/DoxX family redox-associated membrane protein [Kitasatospora sp. NPDC005751]|uniref:MauE/DoxX family redox-associated membrane protein n=1 Tax=Kitasatospora sp. NPDC005751 TaxID=3157064 RepID=UPI0033EAE138
MAAFWAAGVWVARCVVAAVFATAGMAKAADRPATGETVTAFGVPARWAGLVAWALPAVEIVVAIAVLPAGSAVWACAVALSLLVVFSVAVGVQLRRGRYPACSCFGSTGDTPISRWTLVRNGAIAVAVAAAWWGTSAHGDVPQHLPVERAAGLAVIVALAAALTRQTVTTRALRRRLDKAAAPAVAGLPVGTQAPDFALIGTDGTRTGLTRLLETNRPLVLVFIHHLCEPCHLVLQKLPDWQDKYGHALTIVPVATGDLDLNTVWARGHHIDPLYLQPDTEVTTGYRVRGTPSAVLINPTGRIASPLAQSLNSITDLLSAVTTPDRPLPATTGKA